MKEETSLQVPEHMHVLYMCVLPNMIDQTIVIMLRLKDLKAQEAVLELEGWALSFNENLNRISPYE